MGVTFRSGGYIRHVFLGGRTIKDGEAAAIWNNQGQHRQIIGPRRVWMYSSTIRFLTRHKAESHQYLKVFHRDGRVEYISGPISMYENPAFHDFVCVQDAIRLDSESDCIIVTRETTTTTTTGKLAKELSTPVERAVEVEGENDNFTTSERRVVQGPGLYFPTVEEQIHEFSWSKLDDEQGLVENAHKFRVFNTAPNRTLSVHVPLTTSDSLSFGAKLSFQYHLTCLDDAILASDPIASMYTAILKDLFPFGNSLTRDQLRSSSSDENSMTKSLALLDQTFPSLIKESKNCGFAIDNVSVIGLTFGPELKAMVQKDHENALKLGNQLADKKQQLKIKEIERESRKEGMEKEAQLKRTQAWLDEQLEQEADKIKLASLERKLQMTKQKVTIQNELAQAYTASVLSFLTELQDRQVDLTKFMCTDAGISLALPILTNDIKHTSTTETQPKTKSL
jgi:hypothetical protein